jgi:hypothetical protein
MRALHCISRLLLVAFMAAPALASAKKAPGTVVNYLPACTGMYVGSPSIAILPDGSYVASNDYFGPASTEDETGITAVFRSDDKGKTWRRISEIKGQYWSNLFVHKGLLYIMGTWKHNGNVVIRRSLDGGKNWSEPTGSKTGLLLSGEYHTAPVPMVVWKDRLCRAFEKAEKNKDPKGVALSAFVLSAPMKSDLLDADSWSVTNRLPAETSGLKGTFRGWLEGNAVVTPDGRLVDFLRVETTEMGVDMAAIAEVSDDGRKLAFGPESGFLEFSGGARKFTIRYDEISQRYWTITNLIGNKWAGMPAGNVRNTLVLKSSADLWNWVVEKKLLYHPDVYKHGFQYIDWQFDGNDIIFLSRTAYDDEFGGADSFHNANYITFHRIKNFRKYDK